MSKEKNNAYLPNVKWFIEAGLDPKTKLPVKMEVLSPLNLKANIRTQLRVLDEQNAVNRGVWYNLPCNITGQDLERMLYYKGQLCFFYNKDLDEFYFLPFALNSNEGNGLDVYGRYKQVKPIAYNGGAEEDSKNGEDKKKKVLTPVELYLATLSLDVKYAPISEENLKEDDLYNSAVLLYDYTPQYNARSIIPRQQLQEPILDVMSDCIPFMRTALINSTGVAGMRVQDGDQSTQTYAAAQALYQCALTGNPYIPIESTLELQELLGKAPAKAEEFLLAMQSLDNYRLSLYGIDNGGLFEKKAHELQSEADLNGGAVGLIQQDATNIRQHFCNIVNSIWGLGIWYEPSETITKADINGDGVLYDRDENGQQSGIDNGGVTEDDGQV